MKDFPMCGHPEWPMFPPPAPVRTVGTCPEHDYVCPLCGFGRGQLPPCGCGTSVLGTDPLVIAQSD